MRKEKREQLRKMESEERVSPKTTTPLVKKKFEEPMRVKVVPLIPRHCPYTHNRYIVCPQCEGFPVD